MNEDEIKKSVNKTEKETAGAGNAAGIGDTAGIVIDPGAGISEEEQREILTGINRITEKNRLSLTGDAGGGLSGKKRSGNKGSFTAKKKGSLFPVLVNAAAAILLAGGFFFFSSFQGKEEVKIRGGDKIYNIAEQALIEEIRRETASQLEAKEKEITLMTGKLTGVDSELQELQDSVETMMNEKEAELRKAMNSAFGEERRRLVEQNLSEAAIAERMRQFDAERIAMMNIELTDYRHRLDEEREESEAALKSLQEEYRSNLSSLQNERSQLLEASRAREAALRSQLEAGARELAAVSEQNQAALSSARGELERLSSDQEKAAVIESQLGGYYTMVNDQIRKGLLDEALGTLVLMREYLSTSSFQSIRSIQARRTLYAASIDILEGMINDAKANRTASASPPAVDGDVEQIITDLWKKNAELEDSIEELNETADAQASELRRQVTERDTTIAALQSRNSNLTQTMSARDTTISTLQTQNNGLTQTVADRDSAIASLQTQNGNLTQTAADRESTIGELRAQNASQEETIQALTNQLTTIRQTLQTLTQ
jgi:chromosome segregation ATPase